MARRKHIKDDCGTERIPEHICPKHPGDERAFCRCCATCKANCQRVADERKRLGIWPVGVWPAPPASKGTPEGTP